MKYVLIVFLILPILVFAQASKPIQNPYYGYYIAFSIPRLMYTYNNGNYLSMGVKYPLSISENKENEMRNFFVGGKVHLAYMNKRILAIPEVDAYYSIHFYKRSDVNSIAFGAGLTPYYYSPKIAFMYNLITLELAYNIQFKNNANTSFDGFRIGFGIDIL